MPAFRGDDANVTPLLEVVVRFSRLGVTSFGGPVAHLGYFRREFVDRAHWLDDAGFAEIVALCSVLPGPTSSQVGILVGYRRAGPAGAFLAWLAFSIPSALALTALGLALRAAHAGVAHAGTAPLPNAPLLLGVTDGLAAAAAAVVLLAVVQLARNLAATPLASAIALGAFAAALALDRFAPALQWLPLLLGGIAGAIFGGGSALPARAPALNISRRTGTIAGTVLLVALVGLPLVAVPGSYVALFALFFRAGSLVFGGGHVVLPFLQSAIGPLVGERDFFAGYGAAQAVPGPLFTFAAFLGAVNRSGASGVPGAMVALVAIFAPSFLLLAAAVPLWRALRELPHAGAALAGLNASVVGLLAAVFVDPLATSLSHDPLAIVIALGALGCLARLRVPAWAVVLASAAAGGLAGSLVRS